MEAKKTGLNDVKLCKKMGVSYSTYADWKQGKRTPSAYYRGRILDHIRQIAKELADEKN